MKYSIFIISERTHLKECYWENGDHVYRDAFILEQPFHNDTFDTKREAAIHCIENADKLKSKTITIIPVMHFDYEGKPI